jgi:hypothetical protein
MHAAFLPPWALRGLPAARPHAACLHRRPLCFAATVEPDPSPPKRGRGRPRKQPPADDADALTPKPVATVAKSQRGRKPTKAATEEEASKKPVRAARKKPVNASTRPVPVPAKRRRGRPAKTKNTAPASPATADLDSASLSQVQLMSAQRMAELDQAEAEEAEAELEAIKQMISADDPEAEAEREAFQRMILTNNAEATARRVEMQRLFLADAVANTAPAERRRAPWAGDDGESLWRLESMSSAALAAEREAEREAEEAEAVSVEREAIKNMISAKNGMAGDSHPPDFLRELLPLFAAREVQASAAAAAEAAAAAGLPPPPDPEAELYELATRLRNEHASTFRYSGSQEQLLPFRLRRQATAPCAPCDGSGRRACAYCAGAGTVPTVVCGPPGSVAVAADGRRALVPPNDNLLDECVCAFCDGAACETCVACNGAGVVRLPGVAGEGVGDERDGTGRARAAGEEVGVVATETPSKAEFIREFADRVEVGIDGTVILRATKRKGRKETEAVAEAEVSKKQGEDVNVDEEEVALPMKRRRGRPRKGQELDVLFPLDGRGGGGRRDEVGRGQRPAVGLSTDFVNTDIQVLRASRGSGFRRNTAAFSAALTRRLGEGVRAVDRDDVDDDEEEEEEVEVEEGWVDEERDGARGLGR